MVPGLSLSSFYVMRFLYARRDGPYCQRGQRIHRVERSIWCIYLPDVMTVVQAFPALGMSAGAPKL